MQLNFVTQRSGIKKIRRSAEQWQQILQEYEASHLTQTAFCENNSIAPSSFYKWKKALKGNGVKASPFIKLPFSLDTDPETSPDQANPQWRIELDLGQGVMLRLR